ncbi:hypothetical protein [Aquimarina algiphila]|uniref:hypothetical protein n=1 Tax=Aquimarina algiphila TaxID=2047982 RepID=UPI002330651D|nr:hypothetical protein [Aquimarina algiphila]
MREQDRINSELYFDHSNYNFKATILEHHQLNAHTAGVLKLKLIKGEINTYKEYIKNLTTGTFNTKDSIIYAFATFYPVIIREIDAGSNPVIIEMNSKSREVKIFINQKDFLKTKLYYYGDDSFKRRAFIDFLKENNIKNDLFW